MKNFLIGGAVLVVYVVGITGLIVSNLYPQELEHGGITFCRMPGEGGGADVDGEVELEHFEFRPNRMYKEQTLRFLQSPKHRNLAQHMFVNTGGEWHEIPCTAPPYGDDNRREYQLKDFVEFGGDMLVLPAAAPYRWQRWTKDEFTSWLEANQRIPVINLEDEAPKPDTSVPAYTGPPKFRGVEMIAKTQRDIDLEILAEKVKLERQFWEAEQRGRQRAFEMAAENRRLRRAKEFGAKHQQIANSVRADPQHPLTLLPIAQKCMACHYDRKDGEQYMPGFSVLDEQLKAVEETLSSLETRFQLSRWEDGTVIYDETRDWHSKPFNPSQDLCPPEAYLQP